MKSRSKRIEKPWSLVEVATLKFLRAEGLSCAECGERMNRPKGSIVGKLYRIREAEKKANE